MRGAQAVRAVREEGSRVIPINSNLATIMIDPDVASATYIDSIISPDRLDVRATHHIQPRRTAAQPRLSGAPELGHVHLEAVMEEREGTMSRARTGRGLAMRLSGSTPAAERERVNRTVAMHVNKHFQLPAVESWRSLGSACDVDDRPK
jgi:hypothetical protein